MDLSLATSLFHCPGCRKKQNLSKDLFFDGSHRRYPKFLVADVFLGVEEELHTGNIPHLGLKHHRGPVVSVLPGHCSWKLLREPLVLGGVDRCIQMTSPAGASAVNQLPVHMWSCVPRPSVPCNTQ